ncbi:2-oxoacid:acceptor oxidoreductase family protein [Geobacter sp. DSM 9736]|uniref:2-oxoacid:acceptor oxidoreductase family protein n=1 Tax=Geobacter sp. DSM 9736 TaxID=1277350 RepID=UPI000B4FDBA2|nr:2-oxoacid:acceptor oxidoreductase family protein [Geobacter sp. DSM 9736]SNB45565.1 2-oxoglutarate ferredoxin oxidoreductase, gamma subunit [Geobacter sp. DSM 9736]
MRSDLFISGFGGQGVLLVGNLIAYAAIHEGKNVSFFPSYGVEKRGGAAMCTVVVAEGKVGSPVIGAPSATIVLNQASMEKYAERVRQGGLLIVNSSLINYEPFTRNDIRVIAAPMNEIAMGLGDSRLVNMVAAGIYASRTSTVGISSLITALSQVLPERNHRYIPLNVKAIEAGAAFDGDLKAATIYKDNA